MSIQCTYIPSRGRTAGVQCTHMVAHPAVRCNKHRIPEVVHEPVPAEDPIESDADSEPESDSESEAEEVAPQGIPAPESIERLREQLAMCRAVLENTRKERDIAVEAIDTAWRPLVAKLKAENTAFQTEKTERLAKLREYSKKSLAKKREEEQALPEAERLEAERVRKEKDSARAKKAHEKQKAQLAEARRILAENANRN